MKRTIVFILAFHAAVSDEGYPATELYDYCPATLAQVIVNEAHNHAAINNMFSCLQARHHLIQNGRYSQTSTLTHEDAWRYWKGELSNAKVSERMRKCQRKEGVNISTVLCAM